MSIALTPSPVQRWLDLLNDTENDTLARGLLAPDIRIRAHPEGLGSAPLTLEGLDAVMEWIGRAPLGRFRFVATGVEDAAADPALPPADVVRALAFRLEEVGGDWTNEGRSLLHIRGDQLVGVSHGLGAVD